MWLWRPAALPAPEATAAGIRGARVNDASELARWEETWSDLPANEPSPLAPRVFLPSLLEDADIAFIAAWRGERIVAGVIANRTGEVAGVSNLFVRSAEEPRLRASCIRAAAEAFPGLPRVGYESGIDLEHSLSLGFDELGPLRIWAHPG